jgi:hypothetical protein
MECTAAVADVADTDSILDAAEDDVGQPDNPPVRCCRSSQRKLAGSPDCTEGESLRVDGEPDLALEPGVEVVYVDVSYSHAIELEPRAA